MGRILVYVPLEHQLCESRIFFKELTARGFKYRGRRFSEVYAEIEEHKKVLEDLLKEDKILARREEFIVEYMELIRKGLDIFKIDKIYLDSATTDWKTTKANLELEREVGCEVADIVLGLAEKGAEVVPTEDHELCEKTHEVGREEEARKQRLGDMIKGLAEGRFVELEEETSLSELHEKRIQATKERDEYIAKIVDETLKEGETGLVMLGARHNPEFDPSIRIYYLYEPKELSKQTFRMQLMSAEKQ